jgi:HD-GYP domain-containing protein (c-di-GMP phosphodiesterase class II)
LPLNAHRLTLSHKKRAVAFENASDSNANGFIINAPLTDDDHQHVYTPGREDFVIDHEGVLFIAKNLTPEDYEQGEHEAAAKPLWDDFTNHGLFNAIQTFWQRMEKGSHPDAALATVVAEQLCAQTVARVDQLNYLSQLRFRDAYTYSHTLNVCALSIAIALKCGFSPKEIEEIALAAILHDLGKLFIPKPIMFKPTKLTKGEFNVMKLHPEMGYNVIIKELKLSEAIARPALEHQEMYSGGGYPNNLKGDEIHPYSHIVKIADVYDALTSKRPYKGVIPSSKAFEIMRAEADRSFHPELFSTFEKLANHS